MHQIMHHRIKRHDGFTFLLYLSTKNMNSSAADPPSRTSYHYHNKGSNNRKFPRRIILIRHGQSLGNVDDTAYCTIPDWKIPLTSDGHLTSVEVGKSILSIIGSKDFPIFFYCSPYLRTKQTLSGILKALHDNPIVGIREEPQLTGMLILYVFVY